MIRFGWCDYAGVVPGEYQSVAHHLRAALEKLEGVEVVDTRPGENAQPRDVVHVTPATFIAADKGKRNWVLCLWDLEGQTPKNCPPWIRFLVPSKFLQRILEAQKIPAPIVPVGIHEAFRSADTTRALIRTAERPVRFLWFASPLRKEWELLQWAWRDAFSTIEGVLNTANVEIRVKMVGDGTISEGSIAGKKVISDTRRLSVPDGIAGLFAETDVFLGNPGLNSLSPTLDAMASGCLALQVPYRSLGDLLDERNSLIPEGPKDMPRLLAFAAKEWGTDKLEAMRLAGVRMAREHTWARSAEGLVAVIKEAQAGRGVVRPFPAERRVVEA